MSDLKSVLDRGLRGFEPSDDAFERSLRRRDRKRRSQRITAGAVGIAVFVAAVWLVRPVASLNSTETPGIQPAVTGSMATPTVTGPTATGPAETGPAKAPNGWYDGGSPPYDLPSEEAVPSTPEEGELVAKYHGWAGVEVRFVYVYADGRVISWIWTEDQLSAALSERRLTPEGVELVRSGAVQPVDFIPPNEVPADAWEDPEIKPFVPSRYSVCFWMDSGSTRDDVAGWQDPSRVVGFFPAPARAILREATTTTPRGPKCPEVTTDEARTLLDILGTMNTEESHTPYVRVEDSEGDLIHWDIRMVLPHGAQVPCTGCY